MWKKLPYAGDEDVSHDLARDGGLSDVAGSVFDGEYGAGAAGGEFIFAPGSTSFPESHALTVVVLKHGELMAAIVEAMWNNAMSVFTDCPRREKLMWLEETHLVTAGLIFMSDLRGCTGLRMRMLRM